MIIKSIEIEKFRAFEDVSFTLGKRITAISGRNATQKTTVLGMLGQPFTISSKDHPMYGCKTIDGYNFRSQFKEKFKVSPAHDVIGGHKWKLILHNGVYEQDYYSVESIARRQAGHEPTLRFWMLLPFQYPQKDRHVYFESKGWYDNEQYNNLTPPALALKGSIAFCLFLQLGKAGSS